MPARAPRNLRAVFSAKTLTHFGGLYRLQQFFKRLRLRRRLQRDVHFPQRNNRYRVAEMLLALLYPMMLGLGRIEATHLLCHNGVFQYLTGLPTYPDPTALRRFLLRMVPSALRKLRALHDRLLLQMVRLSAPATSFIFDLDSTVLTLYGKQEEARIGYNPRKKGRPSYHPLLCFEGHTQDCGMASCVRETRILPREPGPCSKPALPNCHPLPAPCSSEATKGSTTTRSSSGSKAERPALSSWPG